MVSISPETPLDHALTYAASGFLVVPVYAVRDGICTCRAGASCPSPGKHPRCHHGINRGTKDPKKIRAWWNAHPDSNVGIVTGTASGLLVIDVDPRHGGVDGLRALETELGKLPATAAANTGGGGLHLLFCHPGGRVVSKIGFRPGLDIRADGAFIVVEPSRHFSGGRYLWRPNADPRTAQIASLPSRWLGLLQAEGCYREVEKQRSGDSEEAEEAKKRRSEDSDEANEVDAISCTDLLVEKIDLDALDPTTRAAVMDVIERTLPRGPGKRDRQVFRFTRMLRGIGALANADPYDLTPLAVYWHRQAERFTSGAHSVDDTVADFLYGWPRVKCPGDFDLAKIAKAVVGRAAHPAAIARGYKNPSRVAIVGLCAELQRIVGQSDFYLGTRKAAEVLTECLGMPITSMACYRVLQALVGDHVLEAGAKGNQYTANRYRFVWKPGQCGPRGVIAWLT